METRITCSTVIFARPFQLRGMDGTAPAGSYQLSIEEEKLDTLTVECWRRTAGTLKVVRAGVTEYLTIDPEELRDAQARDGETSTQIAVPLTERVGGVRNILRLKTRRS